MAQCTIIVDGDQTRWPRGRRWSAAPLVARGGQDAESTRFGLLCARTSGPHAHSNTTLQRTNASPTTGAGAADATMYATFPATEKPGNCGCAIVEFCYSSTSLAVGYRSTDTDTDTDTFMTGSYLFGRVQWIPTSSVSTERAFPVMRKMDAAGRAAMLNGTTARELKMCACEPRHEASCRRLCMREDSRR